MRFLLTAAFAGFVLSQTGNNAAPMPATAVAASGSSGGTSSAEAAPATTKKGGKAKNKGKKGKKGKKAKGASSPATPPPSAASSSTESSTESSMEGTFSPTPAIPQQPGIPVTVDVVTDTTEDTTCANAGVGALWCASKKKCLRAWEEPCPAFGKAPASPVAVAQTTAIQPVGSLTVGTNPTTGGAPAATIYPAGVVTAGIYPAVPVSTIYPAAAPMVGVAGSVIYPAVAPAASVVYPATTATPLYPATVVGTNPIVNNAGLIGGQVDNGGCYTGAGYSYCVALARCVRPWETPCPA